MVHLSMRSVSADVIPGKHPRMCAGISAAEDLPQQKPHISTAAGRTSATAQALGSVEALESAGTSGSDQASHSDKGSDSEMLDSDSEGGEVSEADPDGVADLMLVDKEDEDATVTHDSLEERRAGMPAEPSGQPAVTPGNQVDACLLVALPYCTALSMLCVL